MPAVMYKKGDDPETWKISTSQLEKHTWVRISELAFFKLCVCVCVFFKILC
jgi:hypothetical protein